MGNKAHQPIIDRTKLPPMKETETFFSQSYMDEMIQGIANNIIKERDQFIIDQIENMVGKFEHEWELKAFIKMHCRIEIHPHDVRKLFVKDFQVIQWRERIVNEFDFETGKSTTTLIWNQ